jgi:hypothetical protein
MNINHKAHSLRLNIKAGSWLLSVINGKSFHGTVSVNC